MANLGESPDQATGVNRRKLIKTTGGALAANLALAGCVGDDDGNGDDANGDDANGDDANGDDETIDYPDPSRDITGVVPFGPGGGFDWYTRATAPYVEEYLPGDPTIVVDNVEGAAGVVAAQQTYNAEPDGYEYLLLPVGTIISEQAAFGADEAGFDITEYTHLAQVSSPVQAIFQSPDIDPIEDWDSLVEVVTNNEIGTSGFGGGVHIRWVIMGDVTGAWTADDLSLVHYDGTAEQVSAIDRGEVQLGMGGIGSVGPFVDDGLVDFVGQIASEREDTYPEVPTILELGASEIAEFVGALRGPRVFVAPPDTPQEIQDTLESAFMDTLTDDDFLQEAADERRAIHPLNAEESREVCEVTLDVWQDQEELLQSVLE